MRYIVIMAGGSGTRLWPMSRAEVPKQLIPFINGKSLLEVAFDRFEGMIPVVQRYVCANQRHRKMIVSAIDGLDNQQFLGEPVGRDTLNAAGLSAAVLEKKIPKQSSGYSRRIISSNRSMNSNRSLKKAFHSSKTLLKHSSLSGLHPLLRPLDTVIWSWATRLGTVPERCWNFGKSHRMK